MGKKRVIAETGAGQHGVATATVCALLGLDCEVYMGVEDMKRQELNVYRMRILGAKVHGVSSGSKTLKDAINEAIRDWVTNVRHTYYLLGSVLSAHPYPLMVREFPVRYRGGSTPSDFGEGRQTSQPARCLCRRRQQFHRIVSCFSTGFCGSDGRSRGRWKGKILGGSCGPIRRRQARYPAGDLLLCPADRRWTDCHNPFHIRWFRLCLCRA